jgi:DNA polymerase-3 subunit delta'
MIDLLSLVKNTGAYKVISQDKARGKLSHAYLITCSDGDFLGEYLKILAKLIVCDSNHPCGGCRACSLIDKNAHSDVTFYPQEGDAVLVQDVASIIEASYVKPLEGDKRVFVITKGQNMNSQAQNKLLKTLEEPPEGVHILIGTTSEYAMLSTVKSRCKKIEISAFSNQVLYQALKEDCCDEQALLSAIACGDGTLGKACALQGDKTLQATMDLVLDFLVNMRSSKDVLTFSEKIAKSKIDFSQIITITELFLRDLLCVKTGKGELVSNPAIIKVLADQPGYNNGAIVYVLDKLTEAKKRKKFNANQTMLTEWLLFAILEGKFKWQKS